MGIGPDPAQPPAERRVGRRSAPTPGGRRHGARGCAVLLEIHRRRSIPVSSTMPPTHGRAARTRNVTVAPLALWSANASSISSGRRRDSNAYTIRIAPMTTAQMPATVMMAASVGAGVGEGEDAERDLGQPEQEQQPPVGKDAASGEGSRRWVIVRSTMSDAPTKMASTIRLGDGQTMMTTPAAIEMTRRRRWRRGGRCRR